MERSPIKPEIYQENVCFRFKKFDRAVLKLLVLNGQLFHIFRGRSSMYHKHSWMGRRRTWSGKHSNPEIDFNIYLMQIQCSLWSWLYLFQLLEFRLHGSSTYDFPGTLLNIIYHPLLVPYKRTILFSILNNNLNKQRSKQDWYNRVLKWWRRKNDFFSEIMGFIRLFGTTYLKNVHKQKNCALLKK